MAAAVVVAAAWSAACSSSPAVTEDADASPITAEAAQQEPTGLPTEPLAPRADPCRQRPSADFADAEVVEGPLIPDGPPPFPEAQPVAEVGLRGRDPGSREQEFVLSRGQAITGEGAPSLVQVRTSGAVDAEPLIALENCSIDDAFVVSGDFVIAGTVNPSGVAVVDLRQATLRGDGVVPFGAFVVARTHPSRSPGAWMVESDNARIYAVRRLDAPTLELEAPLLADLTSLPGLVDTADGLTVAHGPEVWLVDRATGIRLASWTHDGDTNVELVGGDDDLVWLRGQDELIALSSADLQERQRVSVPLLRTASYGYGRLWYSTLDDTSAQVTIGAVDAVSGERTERAAFESYESLTRGGPRFYSPLPLPERDAVRFLDQRSFATYELVIE